MANLWSDYYSPQSLSSALDLLTKNRDNVVIIAGGTDIVNELKNNPSHNGKTIVDISEISDLNYIKFNEDTNQISIGALITHNEVVKSNLIINRYFSLAKACWSVGSPQIRNRGTVVGNLQTASPANDTIPPLMAIDAIITLQSERGKRDVPIYQFYKGYRKTEVLPDELISEVSFILPKKDSKTNFIKVGLRNSQAISLVNAAAIIELEGNIIIKSKITFGSVAETVVHATEAEDFLIGKSLIKSTVREAVEFVGSSIQPISDIRGSGSYRSELARSCLLKLLNELIDGSEKKSFPSNPITLTRSRKSKNRKPIDETANHSKNSVIKTIINNQEFSFSNCFDKTLLQLIREDAGLTGTKIGCDEGECGSCTVIINGKAVYSCLIPAPCAHNSEIITIEGVSTKDNLHDIQTAFIEESAVQCGYCTPGFIMSTLALFEETTEPSIDDIKIAISGNLCRCTGYYSIIKAIDAAAKKMANKDNESVGSTNV